MNKIKRTGGNFWLLVDALPFALSVFIGLYGIFATSLLLLNQFHTPYLVISAIISALFAYIFIPKKYRSSGSGRIYDLLVLGLVVVWAGVNMHYASQSVLMMRDPGLYTVGARHLMDNPSSNISIDLAGINSGVVQSHSNGVWHDGVDESLQTLQVQGMNMLKVMLGSAGRLFGEQTIYTTNVIFGAGSILMLYVFSKTMMHKRWAAIAALVFAVTLPLIYFSRDTYTEPLAAFFTFGALLWLAYATKRHKFRYWLVAGLLLGGGTMVRPDAYITVAAAMVATTIYLLFWRGQNNSTPLPRASLVPLAVGASIPIAISWLDLTLLNKSYYIGHGDRVKQQLIFIAVVLTLSCALFLINRRGRITYFLHAFSKNRQWAYVFALVVPAIMILLAARPLLITSTVSEPGPAVGQTNMIQARVGDPVVPRDYAEMSTQWVSWYIGEALFALGVIGLGVAVYRTLVKHDDKYLQLTIVVLASALLYFYTPQITPDQIWASRRFMPVVIPGMIIFGIYAASVLFGDFFKKHSQKLRYLSALPFLLVASYLVLQPLLITRPFVRVSEKPDHVQAIYEFCSSLPENAYVVWLGSTFELYLVNTTRVYCNFESVGYDYASTDNSRINAVNLAHIAQQARLSGYEPFVAIREGQRQALGIDDALKPVAFYHTREIEQTVTAPPRDVFPKAESIEVGRLSNDGSVTAL